MKAYIQPETKVVTIAIHKMIAASKLSIGADVTSASGAESRENNAWDIWGTGDDFED